MEKTDTEGSVKMEAEFGVMWPQAKEALSHQKLEGAWNRSAPRACERMGPANTLFWTSGLQTYERINFCFKPLSLW